MRECSFPLCGLTFEEGPLGRPLLAESRNPPLIGPAKCVLR